MRESSRHPAKGSRRVEESQAWSEESQSLGLSPSSGSATTSLCPLQQVTPASQILSFSPLSGQQVNSPYWTELFQKSNEIPAGGIIIPCCSRIVGCPDESKKVGLQGLLWPQELKKQVGHRVAVQGMTTSTRANGMAIPSESVIAEWALSTNWMD